MKYLTALLALAALTIQPVFAQSLDYDLGISGQEIYFSKNTLIVGDQVRVYARVRNLGKNDASGYVRFYQGNSFIGDSQTVSVLAGSVPDEVYLDWIVPVAAFNIRAEIKAQDPKDDNPANDVAITSLFTPKIDTDHDGIFDDVDPDDDNDSLLDSEEIQLGTNPKVADTDGDGVKDGDDFYPLDPSKSEEPKITLPAVKPTPSPAITVTTTAPATATNNTVTNSNTNTNTNSNSNTNSALPTNANVNAATVTDSGLENANAPTPELINEPAQEPTQATVTANQPAAGQLLINTKRVNWQTYQFLADPRIETTQQLEYSWDFGDGSTSTRPYPTHQYTASGDYTVQLSVYDKVKGITLTSDQTTITISFFNIGNYQLWLLILGICAALGIILKIVHKVIAPRD